MNNYIKIIRNILLFSICVMLTSCATMGRAPILSPGSTVAIISDLNNQITYDFIGTTVLQNSHFQYAATNLSINQTLLHPIKRILEQQGFKVLLFSIPEHTVLADFSAGSGTLSDSEKDYLLRILGGKKVDRVLVITKNTPYIYGLPTQHTIGYGYVQKSSFGLKDTALFAAVSVAVIDMHNFTINSLRVSYLTDTADANLFSETQNAVSSTSINHLKQWLGIKFLANLHQTLQQMNAIK